jgi:hypothetical protein
MVLLYNTDPASIFLPFNDILLKFIKTFKCRFLINTVVAFCTKCFIVKSFYILIIERSVFEKNNLMIRSNPIGLAEPTGKRDGYAVGKDGSFYRSSENLVSNPPSRYPFSMRFFHKINS